MNRFFDWLVPSGRTRNAVERKQAGNAMIAFHAHGPASWSAWGRAEFLRKAFAANPVVYRCVRMISEAGASIPFKVTEGRMEFTEHPMLDLMNSPNPRQSGSRLMETIFGNLLIHGNAYLARLEVEGNAKEVHSLSPDKVQPVLDDQSWPVAYEYEQGRTKTRYEVTGEAPQLLHLAFFNPGDDVCGLSPLSAAHMALDIHNSASAWNKALLDNSARPSGALVYSSSAGENLTEEQFHRLREELESGYSGAARAGRPMLLEGGLDWKAMGYSPKDMDFLQAKNGAAREIALALGVPPMLLGIPGDNTYSNYQEANRAFWRQTVLPLATRTATDLGAWLAPSFEGAASLRLDLERVDALAADREAHWNRIGTASFLTLNEQREALGYPPLKEDKIAEIV